jgi:hypothetical protein
MVLDGLLCDQKTQVLQACKRSSTTAGVIFLAALFISLAWVLSQVCVCVVVGVGREVLWSTQVVH